jgi:hypothetical protein
MEPTASSCELLNAVEPVRPPGVVLSDTFEGVEPALADSRLVRAELVDGFDVKLGQTPFGGVVLGRLLAA